MTTKWLGMGYESLSPCMVISNWLANASIVTCQEMLVDHGCRLPFELFWPGVDPAPVRVVPINVNTVQFPIPKASRVFRLGHAVGEAIESFERDVRVAVMATGGLSHQLEGKRAGFINKSFDLAFLDSLVTNPEWATRFTSLELVEQAGTQGVELLMWLAMRAAIGIASPTVRKVHCHYHIPISIHCRTYLMKGVTLATRS